MRPPSPALLALEGRAWLEFAALLPALPLLGRAPAGDGHPVLVLPGWLANDRSTQALRWFLRDRGYHVHGWKLGRNLGPSSRLAPALGQRFTALRARHGRKLSLSAWRSCLEVGAPLCENIEVRSSHCGMGHHPAVLLVIAERLAQPEGAWRPFDPRGRALWPFVVEPVKTLAQGGES